jgi:hypothetical protein
MPRSAVGFAFERSLKAAVLQRPNEQACGGKTVQGRPANRHSTSPEDPSDSLPWRAGFSPSAAPLCGTETARPATCKKKSRWIDCGEAAQPTASGYRGDLLRRFFAIDVWACGCRRRAMAVIKDERVARKILEHLGLPSPAPELGLVPGPVHSALWSTGPPRDDLCHPAQNAGHGAPAPDDFDQRLAECESQERPRLPKPERPGIGICLRPRRGRPLHDGRDRRRADPAAGHQRSRGGDERHPADRLQGSDRHHQGLPASDGHVAGLDRDRDVLLLLGQLQLSGGAQR